MTDLVALPSIPQERDGTVGWVQRHLGQFSCDAVAASPAFDGGQQAADRAFAHLDVNGYASNRSQVYPPSDRGASKLSPYIRHGLLQLRRVWDAAEDASSYDRFRYQGELLWQDYARHWYAVYGAATGRPISSEPAQPVKEWPHKPWWREMACIRRTLEELETDGWCVNQTRMWLASQHAVRAGQDPFLGEDAMFTHLLDGSRAANRMGWQWMAGTSRSRAGGFARQQVLKRAADFCASCSLADQCPIAGYARTKPSIGLEPPPIPDLDIAYGPGEVRRADTPEVVWITAESLGDNDPALQANPSLPVIFVFDERLLDRLQLSGKRLVFLAQCLADLGARRDLTVYLGDPRMLSTRHGIATTFAPVPGFRRIARSVEFAELHPWPWLRPPTEAVRSYLTEKQQMPSFKDWCRLTKPTRSVV